MRTLTLVLVSCLAVSLVGCFKNGLIPDKSTKTQGQATYVSSAAEGGQPVAAQPPGALQLQIILQGDAAWDVVEDGLCTLTQGNAEVEIQTTGTLSTEGLYSSTFLTTQGNFRSSREPLCDSLQNVEFSKITNVQVSAFIPANEENCQDFCQASAEVDCEGAADEESCIAGVSSTCETDCSQVQTITGSGQISTASLAALNGKFSTSGVISADVDLIFDSFE